MKRGLSIALLLALPWHVEFSQQQAAAKTKLGMIVTFADTARLGGRDQETLKDFRFYLEEIGQIAKRDFADVELKIIERGEIVSLPDGTKFNSTNARSPLGIVLSAPGRKRVELDGVQTDADFACAAASFFRRSSSSCPKTPK